MIQIWWFRSNIVEAMLLQFLHSRISAKIQKYWYLHAAVELVVAVLPVCALDVCAI